MTPTFKRPDHRPRRERIASTLSLACLRPGRPKAGTPQPLFMIGSGRSGNTLMRRVLMASGAIYIPPETYVVGQIIEAWQRSSLLPWRQRVWLFCAYFEQHSEFGTFGLSDLKDFANEAAKLPRKDRSLRTLFDTFYRYLGRQSGSDALRWGDKTPFNTYHLPAISKLFPDAQYLWLVRDARDVALSYVASGMYPDLRTAAERWCDANAACKHLASGGHDVRRQTYEALVSEPEDQFRGVFDWANLPFSTDVLTAHVPAMGDVDIRDHHQNVKNPISASSIGQWRERLSEQEHIDIKTICGPQLREFGYDVGEATV